MDALRCVQKNGIMKGHTTFAPSRTIQGSRTAALFSSVQAGKAWKRSRQARRSPHIRSFHCLLGRPPFTILSTDVGSMHRLDPRILPVLAGQETKKPKIKILGYIPTPHGEPGLRTCRGITRVWSRQQYLLTPRHSLCLPCRAGALSYGHLPPGPPGNPCADEPRPASRCKAAQPFLPIRKRATSRPLNLYNFFYISPTLARFTIPR
jgi:hypothetical protein